MSTPEVPHYPKDVTIIRSPRRKRTVQARIEGGGIVVRVPAGMHPVEEQEAVNSVVARVRKKASSTALSDQDLSDRATRLNASVLSGRAQCSSIRWVSNQTQRWGSCSVHSGEIRISDRLQHVPEYVLNAVIVHELVHTFIADHSPAFYEWAEKVPRYERAMGYLEAYQRWGTQA